MTICFTPQLRTDVTTFILNFLKTERLCLCDEFMKRDSVRLFDWFYVSVRIPNYPVSCFCPCFRGFKHLQDQPIRLTHVEKNTISKTSVA